MHRLMGLPMWRGALGSGRLSPALADYGDSGGFKNLGEQGLPANQKKCPRAHSSVPPPNERERGHPCVRGHSVEPDAAMQLSMTFMVSQIAEFFEVLDSITAQSDVTAKRTSRPGGRSALTGP